MSLTVRLAAIAALTLSAVASHAATVSLLTTDNGWYSTVSAHNPSNTNTITGFYNNGEYRSFYVFSLPGLAAGETILSATLSFASANGSMEGQYAQKHLGLFDYTGSINSLRTGTADSAVAFADLGSGKSYGTATLSGPTGTMPGFSVSLTNDAIADLLAFSATPNHAFAIGASLQDPFVAGRAETLWSNSGQNGFAVAARLTLVTGQAVPEPDSIALLGAAALAFGIAALRRKVK